MRCVRGEFGSVGVSFADIKGEICSGFAPGRGLSDGEIGLVLGMGLNVIQCVNGRARGLKGGSLVSFDYVVSLRSSCPGCDKFPAFEKNLEIED